MRLRRLDLTRYGKFTDHAIDFGERTEGVPDLHIVYGPNEAGKSTTLAAFLDLLFGIGGQSPYNFLHPYPTMRIGGVLDFSDGPRSFGRLKKPQASLLDGNDQVIPETAIRVDLGGIDRDAYRTMFSLDDETLEKGGESILASKGDLGELLFSAGAGLADLSRNLLGLRAEADGFYKYRARGGALADLKARLATLKAEREQFDTIASDYARLIATRDRANAQYDEAIAGRSEVQGRLDAVQRSLNALPRLAALRAIRERLAPLAGLPEPPGAWLQDLPSLQKQEIELGIRLKSAEDELRRLQDEIDAITVDEVALKRHDALDRLEGMKARYSTAEIDLPERRVQVRAADLAVAAILARLDKPGEEEPRRLLLGASVTGRLRELIETRSGLDAAREAALTERANAERRLTEAQERLQASDAGDARAPAAMAGLAATLSALRGSDHDARRRLAERARDAERARLADRLRMLAPWQGEADELLALRYPEPATIRGWGADLEARETAVARHAGEVERLRNEVGRLIAERAAMASVKGLVDDREAAELRAGRERAWATHRRDLTSASADAFEALLRQDDLVASARLGHVADLAILQQRAQALAIAEAELRRAEGHQAKAAEALSGLRGDIASAISRIASALDPAMTPAELDGWLTRRANALAVREALFAAESDLREALADERDGEERMRTAFDAAGLAVDSGAGFAALLATAQSALDRQSEIRGLREDVEERERDLAGRHRAVEQAETRGAGWSTAWAETCAGCWLGEGRAVPSVSAVREMLIAIEELAPAVQRKTDLAYRIDAMTKDQEEFRAFVARMAGELGLDEDAADPLGVARRVGERIREARTEQERRKKLVEAAEEAGTRKARLAETLAIYAGRKGEMTALFAVETLVEVGQCLADVGRRSDLREQAEAAEREILDALRLASLAEAEQRLDAADREALDADLAELQARLADQVRLCEEIFAQLKDATGKVEAIGGDDKVAEIEGRRRTTLLEIEDGAARYLQLRAGTAATEHGLRIYRERHRSSMMTRASDAFRTISRGAYSGLTAQPDKDGETLIALSAGGGSKEADQLSKGTRFQLYLALRVAGYHEFVQARAPLPFIADDIMETFDDFRAEEAFGLLAGMARVGQVVYLTHHSHLCEVARRAGPGVTIHSLPGA
ncbi:ATP-binding protein [Methylobacterium brachythecii]|uniref:Sugar translocase n=1 Tax=Methylobacterium brachythecii TaxID=1176177 RepID=A0A7W6AFZ2_9HYPH|nr:AAA family ATPase [Methylobacterium brachythecii]MBB3900539.1 uncharacterized protein YhaN [Methylobacterium brachythecii]GLS43416.1 sugar translocase [Methylobacterium brachythecii]